MLHTKCFFLFTILLVTILVTCAKKKDSSALQEFLSKEKQKFSSNCPKKISSKNVDYLIQTTEADKSTGCVIRLLEEDISDGHLWSHLGSLFSKMNKTSQASTCFKQATKRIGEHTDFVKNWYFLGPFVIGKMELDGDPLEIYGGIRNVSKYINYKKMKFYSELAPKGEISWRTYKQSSAEDSVQISPQINWNDLVNSLGSMAITEWQGWVVGQFAVNERKINLVVQCLGVHTFFIDDTILTGDVYQRQQYWTSASLSLGIHYIYIKLRTKVTANFRCSLKKVSSTFEVLSPHYMPDLHDGYFFGSHVAVPVVNYHSKRWLQVTKVTIQDQSAGNPLTSVLYNRSWVAPGQTLPVVVTLQVNNPSNKYKVLESCSTDTQLFMKLTTTEGPFQFKLNLRCRKLGESFLFTFLDHDGSVQHAAAIAPIEDCVSNKACPVILSLHGTTVPPQNQADSYKRMQNGEYVFGSDKAWVLAPTRHGAHNWEGPGTLTAMTSLERLSQLTNQYDWITHKADQTKVIFAGHSMGGHGAWHLATHYPDRALALVSLAGWIKKEEYGDSNLFFKHDVSTSYVDPAVKSVMEACIAENDADKHVTNLQDIPVLARIGANDRTVHPYFTRRMYRLLQEVPIKVNYTELEGKEHWWWDTWETNDGGVVNDKQLRDFTDQVIISSDHTCSTEEEDCKAPDPSIYSQQKKSFVLTCYNPALGEGLNGLRIVQQRTPFRLSKIQVEMKGNSASLSTINVASFSMREPANRRMHWSHLKLKIDGQSVDISNLPSDILYFCFKTAGTWSASSWYVCDESTSQQERGPHQYGPSRRIAENPFLIVIDTNTELVTEVQELAVYIANLFFLTSDTTAVIVKQTDLTQQQRENSNLIVLTFAPHSLDICTLPHHLSIKDNEIRLEKCSFIYQRTGVMTLLPNKMNSNRLCLLLSGNSLAGLRDVVSLATPTIPPMTRSPFSNLLPDYVITGPEFGLKGPGGFLCAGFWGNKWEYRADLASCVCH